MPPVADILSTLPNPLLGLILSKLPIREAVRCSVLSKRWKFLYTQIPQLTLSPILLVPTTSRDPNPDSVATVEKIISNLLMLHSADIEAFHLFTYHLQFTRESVWQWVTYAASRNVQHLSLCDSPKEYCNLFIYNPGREIPPALFSCTHLATLKLSNYNLKHLPTHFSGFNHLITCSFEGMQLTDEFLSCFISHSPFLQKLTLHFCVGLRKSVISAPNLTHLSVDGRWEALTVNCPKFRTLEMVLPNIGDLRINGVLFHELSCLVSKTKMQCGSNVAVLWLTWGYASVERVLEIVGKALKKLVINDMWSERQMVVFVDNLLERLPGLTRVRVRSMFDLVRQK